MITTKQRAYLRSKANDMDTILQIGKGGISERVIKQIDDALNAREMIKIKVLENAFISPREVAAQLMDEVGCDIVQTIGSKLVIYRQIKEKDKRIYVLK